MAILFQEYELLAKSGLFDPTFYLAVNPDVAALSVDPLVHYLERGCYERRNPGPRFDTLHYLAQCQSLGELPVNALVHYLTVGVKQGFTPTPGHQGAPATLLRVDVPRIVDGIAQVPGDGGLSIVGWGWTAGGAVSVDIALDGTRVTSARYGMRRPDVEAAYPDRVGALLSGYTAHIPPRALVVGQHRVTVSLRGPHGVVANTEFQIEVQAIPEDRGPWALRRKMSQAEVELKLETLMRLDWRPSFRVVLPLARERRSLAAARLTLESLSRQIYPQWDLCLIPRASGGGTRHQSNALRVRLIEGLEDVAARVRTEDGVRQAPARDTPSFLLRLAPGDELGCDALLEFALASGLNQRAELLYCDERRKNPVDRKVTAFFKPTWSPDLLLSTNYIGRSWCADARLIERAHLTMAELSTLGDYDLTLRVTETARNIHHQPKLLHARSDIGGDSAAQERQALKGALRRRKIAAQVHDDPIEGHYRIARQLSPDRVSVIIPTCWAGGLVKTCIESLRTLTRYRDFEIICIENIAADTQQATKQTTKQNRLWLSQHADIVLRSDEPFNWSRYNNAAAERASGKHLLFLNDDTEIIEKDWLHALVEQAQRPEVGVVGALLLYPNRTVQHAGVMLDEAGRGRHAFRHLHESNPGYFGLALTQRNVIGVTGACLMTRRETFDALGRFDEAHAVVNNDLDFCLRARSRGLLNVYTPHARLIHHELASRSRIDDQFDAEKFNRQWGRVIALGDPYFNPHLSREQEQVTIEREPFETIYAGHPAFARAAVRRILVVKLDHIGDCVTALPAVRRLKQLFPAARVTVLAARSTQAIWAAATTVDDTIEFNFFHTRSGLGKRQVTDKDTVALGKLLRARQFDLAIDLRKQPDTREVLQLSGAGMLVGFDHQGRFPWLDVALEWDEDVPLRTKHGHIADDLVTLVEAIAAHSDTDRRPVMSVADGPLSLSKAQQRRLFSKPLICIHAAAGTPMRQWPPQHFGQLIDLLNDGNVTIALIGGVDDRERTDQVLAQVTNVQNVVNMVGQLSLSQLPQLIARATLFAGNDSGPKHIAAALGIATVGIHSGIVDPMQWGPTGKRAIAVRRQMSCAPCYLEEVKSCPRGLACLRELAVADVYRACRELICAAIA